MLFYLHLLFKISNEHWTFSGGRYMFKFRAYKSKSNHKFQCRLYNLIYQEAITNVVVALNKFGKKTEDI